MNIQPNGRFLAAALSVSAAFSTGAGAVYVDPDGKGQALIYPYYTARLAGANPFNTYISVANHTARAKVVRVRFREGKAGREAIDFNVYLSPNDMWTGAVVPTVDGAKVISADVSCTNPPLFSSATPGMREIAFNNFRYTGALADGLGDSLDRTREGYVEMIEMATLTGISAGAVTHTGAGVPANCAVVQGPAVVLQTEAPTGGLSGTLTLINVANGMDFTVNALALADLTTQPFYRNPGDGYPDYDAAEVSTVSHMVVEGKQLRMLWTRGQDAVSSVLMQTAVTNEYVLDAGTNSSTDWILTFPTRRLYVTGASSSPPFAPISNGQACEPLVFTIHNREAASAQSGGCGFGSACGEPLQVCSGSSVVSMAPSSGIGPLTQSRVLGSTNVNRGLANETPSFVNGWGDMRFFGDPARRIGLTSLPGSTSRDLRTDAVATSAQTVYGLPVAGFMVRTFSNGTLSCGAGNCQGNYGGAFPHKAIRSQVAPP